jgi:hypothetical protein
MRSSSTAWSGHRRELPHVCAVVSSDGFKTMVVVSMVEIKIERGLREAAAEFIESHRRTEVAISEAASAGMTSEVIAHVSGLSPETVDAFLRQLGTLG